MPEAVGTQLCLDRQLGPMVREIRNVIVPRLEKMGPQQAGGNQAGGEPREDPTAGTLEVILPHRPTGAHDRALAPLLDGLYRLRTAFLGADLRLVFGTLPDGHDGAPRPDLTSARRCRLWAVHAENRNETM